MFFVAAAGWLTGAGEGSEFTLKMTMGCILAVVGFGAYSHAKMKGFGTINKPLLVPSSSSSSVEESEALVKKGEV